VKEVEMVPVVISAAGVVLKSLQRSLSILDLDSRLFAMMQKSVVMSTTTIVRKFLNQAS